MSEAPRHSTLDDAQGLLFGTSMCALGVVCLQQLGLVTGQIAGLAVVLSYATDIGFGVWFFVLNLPFYGLALRRIGLRFTLKTLIAVVAVSAIAEALRGLVEVSWAHPAPGAILIGMILGAGLLATFRHGASLGGVGVVALCLQDKTGFRAGWTQILVDVAVFAAAFAVLPWTAVLWSALGALVLNLVIALNHRRDRYVAL